MIYKVFATLDKKTGLYSDAVIMFVSKELGYGQLRRSIRDEYLRGNITLDWIKEHDYILLADYDSQNGVFLNDDDKDFVISCYGSVRDLVDGD